MTTGADRYEQKTKRLKKHKQMIELWAIEQSTNVQPETIRLFSKLINRLGFEISNREKKLKQMRKAA